MIKTRKYLQCIFWVMFALAVIIFVGCESGLFETGLLADNLTASYYAAMGMELLMLAIIPLALRLFKFHRIHEQLVSGDGKYCALKKFGTVRMLMIFIPLLLNLVFYYLFMATAFGYMAIILVLCLFFIYPSAARCEAETTDESSEKK